MKDLNRKEVVKTDHDNRINSSDIGRFRGGLKGSGERENGGGEKD